MNEYQKAIDAVLAIVESYKYGEYSAVSDDAPEDSVEVLRAKAVESTVEGIMGELRELRRRAEWGKPPSASVKYGVLFLPGRILGTNSSGTVVSLNADFTSDLFGTPRLFDTVEEARAWLAGLSTTFSDFDWSSARVAKLIL